MPNFLVLATSGRAIAQGLKSLGYSVTVVDGFADCDTRAAATEIKKVKRTQYGLDEDEVLQAVSSLQSNTSFDGLFFDAAMESNPSLLDEINVNPIYGNSSQVLKASKSPNKFFLKLDQHTIPYPEISFKPLSNPSENDTWLAKDAQSTGGVGIAPMTDTMDFASNVYLQKKIDGINFSLTFLANGSEIAELGFNTLWSEPLGDSMPYAYAGAINQVKLEQKFKDTALQYTKVIVKEFGLVGLNCIDFICEDNFVYVLELNPRMPATYELYETKYGDVMKQHIEVCESQKLPVSKIQPLLRAHAIVYAPIDIKIPENMSWPLWTADRPHAQELIKKHEPVCSVFAGGKNSAQANRMIKTRKQSILAKLVV